MGKNKNNIWSTSALIFLKRYGGFLAEIVEKKNYDIGLNLKNPTDASKLLAIKHLYEEEDDILWYQSVEPVIKRELKKIDILKSKYPTEFKNHIEKYYNINSPTTKSLIMEAKNL